VEALHAPGWQRQRLMRAGGAGKACLCARACAWCGGGGGAGTTHLCNAACRLAVPEQVTFACMADVDGELVHVSTEVYSLRGALVHTGSPESGHFVAYAFDDGRCLTYDGAKVRGRDVCQLPAVLRALHCTATFSPSAPCGLR